MKQKLFNSNYCKLREIAKKYNIWIEKHSTDINDTRVDLYTIKFNKTKLKKIFWVKELTWPFKSPSGIRAYGIKI